MFILPLPSNFQFSAITSTTASFILNLPSYIYDTSNY